MPTTKTLAPPTPGIVTGGQKEMLIAAGHTMCLFALPVLAVLGYATFAGPAASPFANPRAGWLVLAAAAALGLLVGAVMHARGTTFALFPANHPSFNAITAILAVVVVGLTTTVAALGPPKKSDEQILLENENAKLAADKKQAEDDKAQADAKIEDLKRQKQAAEAAGRPDPKVQQDLDKEKDRSKAAEDRAAALQKLVDANQKRNEEIENGTGAPPAKREDAEKFLESSPKPPAQSEPPKEPIPSKDPTDPTGDLPPKPAGGSQANPIDGVAKMALMLLAAKFPALAPIAAALGLNMGMFGTDKRDLKPVAMQVNAMLEKAKNINVPEEIQKIVRQNFANPVTAIAGMEGLLNSTDPKVKEYLESKLGPDKLRELTEQLATLKLLWLRMDRIVYNLGGADKALKLCELMPDKLSPLDQRLTDFAKAVPPEFQGTTPGIWRAVLKEFVTLAGKGQALKVDPAGKVAPYTIDKEEVAKALAAINDAGKKPVPTSTATTTPENETGAGSKKK